MIDLDDRLDRAADDLWSVVPVTSSAAPSRTSGHARTLVGLAASAVLLVALVAVWTWRDEPPAEPLVDAPAATTTVPATTLVPPAPAPTNPQPTSAWPPAGSILETEVDYVIREGDDPATVASLWQVPFDDLMTLNGWSLQPDGIVPEWPGVGATIRIPAGATVPDLGMTADVDVERVRTVDVFTQKMQVTLTSDLTCENASRSPGSFDSYELELFSDRTNSRWLMRATFPDRTTYELVATGSVIYPKTLHERGTWKGAAVGCAPDVIMGFTPGQTSITALNLEPELADDEVVFFAGDVAAAATPLADERTTSLGLRGSAFESVVRGFATDDETKRAITQTTTWIVADGTVVERTFENRIEGRGVATTMISMVGYGGVPIEASAFDTTGWTPLAPMRRPDGAPDRPVEVTTPAVEACGTYTVVEGDVPAAVAAKLATTFEALAAVNVDTPGWDSWFPGLQIQVPC
jgi:hypothetical protein